MKMMMMMMMIIIIIIIHIQQKTYIYTIIITGMYQHKTMQQHSLAAPHCTPRLFSLYPVFTMGDLTAMDKANVRYVIPVRPHLSE
jgi:hypothetical protein